MFFKFRVWEAEADSGLRGRTGVLQGGTQERPPNLDSAAFQLGVVFFFFFRAWIVASRNFIQLTPKLSSLSNHILCKLPTALCSND